MKKFAVMLVVSLLLMGCTSNNSDTKENNDVKEEKNNSLSAVSIHLFHWTQCSHCQEEKEWLETMDENYDYLTVNYYEVTEYENFVSTVREKLGIEDEYVPLTVIGDQYFVGFSGSTKTKINKLIEKYQNQEYCDIIDYIKNDKDLEECHKINEQFN